MTNDQKLKNLKTYAEARRNFADLASFAKDGGYVRLGGSGYRAVSVVPTAPLMRFEGARVTKNLDAAVQQCRALKPAPMQGGADKSKRERMLQAHLIRSAFMAKLDLCSVLKGLPYERLLFAVDELSLEHDGGTLRCDLIAVGVTPGGAIPVLIELKYERQLGKLLKQLKDYARVVFKHRELFSALLCAATGEKVAVDRVQRLLVWPKATGVVAEQTRKTLEDEGVLAVGAVFPPNGVAASHNWEFHVEQGHPKDLFPAP